MIFSSPDHHFPVTRSRQVSWVPLIGHVASYAVVLNAEVGSVAAVVH